MIRLLFHCSLSCMLLLLSCLPLSAQEESPKSITLGKAMFVVGDVITSQSGSKQNSVVDVKKGGATVQTLQQGEDRADNRVVTVLSVNEAGEVTAIKVHFRKRSAVATRNGKAREEPPVLIGRTLLVSLLNGELHMSETDGTALNAATEAAVRKAFTTAVGPVLVQRKFGALLGGRTFKVGETIDVTGEQVRRTMGLPEQLSVTSMTFKLKSIKKPSLLNPESGLFEIKLGLNGIRDGSPAAKGVKGTETVTCNGTLMMAVQSGHLLSIKVDGVTELLGTAIQGTTQFDLHSKGTLHQEQLLVYSKVKPSADKRP